MRMRCFLLLFVSAFAGAALAAKCPDGWDYFRRACYLYSTEKANWDKAQAKCKSLGGKLVEIETPQEDCFVRSLAEEHEETSVFIGGNDKAVEDTYVWASTGESIWTYTNWGEGEPSNRKTSDKDSDCISLWKDRDYKWDDISCSELHPFICEKSADLHRSGWS